MLRICGVVRESIVDGPGLRFVLFTQGCPHHCPGCHNPQSHDPQGGYLCEEEKILTEFKKNPLLKGMTFSGGEPILQAEELLPLAREVRAMGKDLVLYTGYTWEQLMEMKHTRPAIGELLSLCALVVDGPYLQAQRDLTLVFRGSGNQRLINPSASLQQGQVVLRQDL